MMLEFRRAENPIVFNRNRPISALPRRTDLGRLLPVITRGRAGQWDDDLNAERGCEAVEFWLLRRDIRVADLLHIGKLDLISTT